MTLPLPLHLPRYEFSSESDSEYPEQTDPELRPQITMRRHQARPPIEEANTGLTAQKHAKASALNISALEDDDNVEAEKTKNTAAWASEAARVTGQQKAVKAPPAPSKKPVRQEAEAEQDPPASYTGI